MGKDIKTICPGSKIKSKGLGQGLGIGKGKGPIGRFGTKLSLITLGKVTRLLRTVRGLKGNVYVVGGLVTEGSTLRDIDIVISHLDDIPNLRKHLGKFADRAHFIQQKKEPPATLFVKVTGKEGSSPDTFKGKGRMPKNEYAN